MPKTRNIKKKNSRKSRKNRSKKGAGWFTKSPELKALEKMDSIMHVCEKEDSKTCVNKQYFTDVKCLELQGSYDKIKNKANERVKQGHRSLSEYLDLLNNNCHVYVVPKDQVRVVSQPLQAGAVSGEKRKSRKNRRNRRSRRRNKNKRSRKQR